MKYLFVFHWPCEELWSRCLFVDEDIIPDMIDRYTKAGAHIDDIYREDGIGWGDE